AANNPYKFTDPDGRFFTPETIWDAANVVIGAVSAYDNFSAGNIGAGFVDVGGVLVDGAATLIPGVPGGAGATIKAARGVDAVVDAARGADKGRDGARFVGQPDGTLVDTHATPRGSYDQPNGSRTDVLQGQDHGAGHSHTHDKPTHTNPRTGETFTGREQKPGRPVSFDEARSIESGAASPTKSKGR